MMTTLFFIPTKEERGHLSILALAVLAITEFES